MPQVQKSNNMLHFLPQTSGLLKISCDTVGWWTTACDIFSIFLYIIHTSHLLLLQYTVLLHLCQNNLKFIWNRALYHKIKHKIVTWSDSCTSPIWLHSWNGHSEVTGLLGLSSLAGVHKIISGFGKKGQSDGHMKYLSYLWNTLS